MCSLSRLLFKWLLIFPTASKKSHKFQSTEFTSMRVLDTGRPLLTVMEAAVVSKQK